MVAFGVINPETVAEWKNILTSPRIWLSYITAEPKKISGTRWIVLQGIWNKSCDP
jgi:hypothetical protein